MCTSIILFRKKNLWPVIIGSNRDERLDRKSLFPGRNWKKKYPNIVGGKDLEKQGSWIGVNDFGITAIIHNRKLDKKLVEKKNSRGIIILETLKHSSIKKSLKYISSIDKNNYNSFNLLVANYNECYWIKNDINVDNLVIKKLNYGTKSSSLIGLPNKKKNDQNIVFKTTNSFPVIDTYLDVIF